jgi:hypothetical protein
MEDEVFREMAVPMSLQGEGIFNFFMAVVDGLLAVIPYGDDEDMPVWVMKEYGRAESWTKQFDIKFVCGSYGPIGFTKNGEVLVNHEGNLSSYDRNSEQSWYLHICEIHNLLRCDPYVESLTLLNVADGISGVQATLSFVTLQKKLFFATCSSPRVWSLYTWRTVGHVQVAT